MAEGTDPLFVNWRTGVPMPVVDGIPAESITTAMLADLSVTIQKLYGSLLLPQGRICLATNTPIITADVTSTTVFYTPFTGRLFIIYDGDDFKIIDAEGELSQATTDATKSPAAVANNTNYDIFGWLDGNTPRATRGFPWASANDRGSGGGTAELTQERGIWLNASNITNGPASRRGTYLGTIRSNGSAQIQATLGTNSGASGGVNANLSIWNKYNRTSAFAVNVDSDGATNYTINAWRNFNASANNRINILVGQQEDTAQFYGACTTINTSAAERNFGLGFDVSGATSPTISVPKSSTTRDAMAAFFATIPTIGTHFCQLQQQSDAVGTTTWNSGLMYCFWRW